MVSLESAFLQHLGNSGELTSVIRATRDVNALPPFSFVVMAGFLIDSEKLIILICGQVWWKCNETSQLLVNESSMELKEMENILLVYLYY